MSVVRPLGPDDGEANQRAVEFIPDIIESVSEVFPDARAIPNAAITDCRNLICQSHTHRGAIR